MGDVGTGNDSMTAATRADHHPNPTPLTQTAVQTPASNWVSAASRR